MSLRHKILLTIVLVLLFLLAVLSVLMSSTLLQRFSIIEQQMVERNLERLSNLVDEELKRLKVQVRDYAAWNETYHYMKQHNQNYINDNFSHTNLDALNLNWVTLLDMQGQPLASFLHDTNSHDINPATPELQTFFGKDSPFIQLSLEQPNLAGILQLSDRLILFSAHAVLTTELKGPIRGVLIMGRYLNSDKLAQLSELMQLNLSLQSINQPLSSTDFNSAWQHLQEQQETHFIKTLSSEKIAGYLTLFDFQQHPALILRLVMNRDLYQQGLNNIYYLNAAILITGLLFIAVLLLLLERLILSRLMQLSEAMSQVSLELGQAHILPVDHRHDELSQLTESINTMLASLHANHQQLKRSETRLKNAQHIAHIGHWEWDLERAEHYWSTELYQLLGLDITTTVPSQVLFLQYLHPADKKRVQAAIEHVVNTTQAYELEHRLINHYGQERILHTRIEHLPTDAEQSHHLIATVQDVTETHRAQAETERLLSENRFLIHRSIAIQEKERSYLARELHDQFGQNITAIQADAETILELTHAMDNDVRRQLAAIQISIQAILDLSSQMYGVMHGLLQYLRPSGLEELGLTAVLQDVIKTWQERHSNIKCQFYAPSDLMGFDEQINITLYRVIQECLKNISRHANANTVNIQLTHDTDNDVLMLQVIDDGKGMDIYQQKWGLGLIGMRERVQALEGELQVFSQPMQGVSILLLLPVGEEFQQKYKTWQ